MKSIDVFEMIEAQLEQPPYNLPKGDGRRQELVYDLVGLIPPRVFASALREIAARTGFQLESDEICEEIDNYYADFNPLTNNQDVV
tara:strand:- start:1036 stop:1293 length:258 start_codon:yes stop_codon:yes gene_type:complete